MSDEDIKLCTIVLDSTKKIRQLTFVLQHIQNKIGDQLEHKQIIRAIKFLEDAGLFEVEYKLLGHPDKITLTIKGTDVRNVENGFKKFVEEKKLKEKLENERQLKQYELTDLQISKIKEEIELKISEQQKEFYKKSIEKLTNDLDEKARAIEKELKLTTIQRNKISRIAILVSIAALLVSIFR